LTRGNDGMSKQQSIKKKKVSESAGQTSLPLQRSRADARPESKLVFQLKTEMHRLQNRDREWKMLFQMLAHDLKEPLLTVEGFSKLLEDSAHLDKDQKRYLKVIRESVNSLHQLIGSMQSIAKLYQEPAEKTEVSLKQLLQNVATILSEQLKKSRGEIIMPKDDIVFRTEPVRVYQIFLNLIANSLKFHRKDVPPRITIRHTRDPKYYRISIEDNGIGIDKKDIERIFAPFTRLEEVSTEGLGLGLSIVKRLTEGLGGFVSVRSHNNKGSVFHVHLPRENARKLGPLLKAEPVTDGELP
jgi:signal transduction histidine kinase